MALPAIILVRPRNPRNIGAAARAMANFGFDDLRVVAPHPPVWEEALASAPGAGSLLRRARVFGSVAEAVADRRRVWATSAMKARGGLARELPRVRPGRDWGVLFGPEKTGLTAADLEHADGLLRIPTASGCPSMNLGQAVAVLCYEWGSRRGGNLAPEPRVPAGELERIVEDSAELLERAGYRPALDPEARRARLRAALKRRGLSGPEAGVLREVLRRLDEALGP